jgi:hypothetical protein
MKNDPGRAAVDRGAPQAGSNPAPGLSKITPLSGVACIQLMPVPWSTR